MKIVTTEGGAEIKLYSSAKEMPISRYIEFQKQVTIESGVGASIEAINSRFSRIKAFLEEGQIDNAMLENENALQACFSALSGVSYYTLAFACLVAEIGGELRDDTTQAGLEATVAKLRATDVKQQEIEDAVEEIKKKS